MYMKTSISATASAASTHTCRPEPTGITQRTLWECGLFAEQCDNFTASLPLYTILVNGYLAGWAGRVAS